MFKLKNLPLTISTIVVTSLIIGWGISMVLAWIDPTADPPGDNVFAPINVAGIDQYKQYVNPTDGGRAGFATDGLDTGYGLTVGNSANNLGIKAAGPSWFGDTVTAASFLGTISAANVSMGTFGSLTGYGNYDFKTSGGFPILHIDALNARVGIGDTTPDYELDVSGDMRVTGTIYGTVAAGGAAGGWVDDGTIVRLETDTDNVGIGTTDPGSYKLDVNGDIRANAFFYRTDAGYNWQPGASWNMFYTPDGYIALGPSDSTYARIHTDMGSFYLNKPLYAGNGNVLLNSSGGDSYINGGNVGIGTMDPVGYKLYVKGTQYVDDTLAMGYGDRDTPTKSSQITHLATPTYKADAANKSYVDSVIGGGEPGVYVNAHECTVDGTCETNDIRVGPVTDDDGSIAGWGNRVYFSGGDDWVGWDSDNSDSLYIGRYNTGNNTTDLRIIIGDDTGSSDDRLTIGTTGNNELFVFDAAGNVGIGDPSPTNKLSVGGNIAGSGVLKISGSGDSYIMDELAIGGVTANDRLDVVGWTDSSSGFKINGKKAGEWGYSASIGSTGWYRIAANSGNRANALFTLRDYISGGGHSTLTFRAGISYNDANGMSFTVLNHSKYSTATFTKVRILEATTYDPQYLEVYIVRTGSMDFTVYDNMQSAGWVPVNWQAGSIPGGYAAREYDVDKLFVVGDYDDRFIIDRGGNVGITGLVSCDTINTDASGNLSCGTDADTWITTQTCSAGQYLTSVGKTSNTCSTPPGGITCDSCDTRFLNTNVNETTTGSLTVNNIIAAQSFEYSTDSRYNWMPGAGWNTFNTEYGNIQLGPANATWAHIYTNIANGFYMDKGLSAASLTSRGNLTVSGVTRADGGFQVDGLWAINSANTQHRVTSGNSYSKYCLWNGSTYCIGMYSAQTYGGLNDYAMTFTMNNDTDRGWLWRDSSDAASDGAMSLTTTGVLTVKGSLTVPKLYVTTIDPIYEIDGKKYATYVADFAGGVRTETSGVIQLNSEAKYVIDFDDLEKGSDLWLFWETSNKEMDDLVVILSSGFEGKVWYNKNGNKLTIFGDESGEVSYRLTLPRLDDEEWGNLVEK